ncbi:hypothetical protein COO60DRAFT_1009928 [Scenedesmus sp. NREL 46B-D3]|nr:hypothetical protein COO60DRAFT_1009928 [Scenedesmus sp. NREL 46B-D3]
MINIADHSRTCMSSQRMLINHQYPVQSAVLPVGHQLSCCHTHKACVLRMELPPLQVMGTLPRFEMATASGTTHKGNHRSILCFLGNITYSPHDRGERCGEQLPMAGWHYKCTAKVAQAGAAVFLHKYPALLPPASCCSCCSSLKCPSRLMCHSTINILKTAVEGSRPQQTCRQLLQVTVAPATCAIIICSSCFCCCCLSTGQMSAIPCQPSCSSICSPTAACVYINCCCCCCCCCCCYCSVPPDGPS